jgi:hypothetical protein
MDKVYYLDISTLRAYLRGQSAYLFAEVKMPGQKEVLTGYVFLKNSTITACLIQTANKTIYEEGEQAYQLLKDHREWRVCIAPDIEETYRQIKQQGSPPRQGIPAAPPTPNAPRPLVSLDQSLFQTFPPKNRLVLRMVFALVNGQRTPAQIKAQLRLPAETVDEALQILHSMGIIE